MKSLVLAIIFFGVLVYGCYDVKPFRAIRKLVRRPSRAATPPAEPGVSAPEPTPQPEPPLSRRYR